VAVNPRALDPQAAGELTGADQLRLFLGAAVSEQLRDSGGDPLDSLRREVDRDAGRRRSEPALSR
jgi:hypothetical protein